jgi:hypothetical protein
MITPEELRIAIDTRSVGRGDIERAIHTINSQAQRIAELDAKWRDYENNYILPVFKWAEEMKIDLPALVAAGGGNCVELFVKELRKRIAKLEAQLLIEPSADHIHGQIAGLRWAREEAKQFATGMGLGLSCEREADRLEATLKP